MTTAGTLTFLFTDLVGSTDLLTRMGDDAAVAVHHRVTDLLRRTLSSHRGHEVKSLGDGLMVAFGSAVDAVGAAVEMQAEIAASDLDVAIRIGINSGEAITQDGDYHGTPVVTAQRLCDLAEGGQTLVSGVTRALTGTMGGYSFVARGRHALKGLAGTTEVWVVDDGSEGSQETETLRPQVPFPTVVAAPDGGHLIGRQEALDRLTDLWARVAEGSRQIALIAGEPGIGKTATVAFWSRNAFETGSIVVAGRSAPEEIVPYQPFVEIIHQLLDDPAAARAISSLGPQAAELSRLVPDLASWLPTRSPVKAEPGTERYLLYEAVVAALNRVAEEAPMVAILDDLHWADAPTVGLLSHLARHPNQGRILVIGTYRETDLGRTHPLAATLAELRRGRFFERIRLSGLELSGVAEILSVKTGGAAPIGVSEAIWNQTEGNPFFVEEVVANLLESDVIGPGVPWPASTQLHELEIPEGIREVIGRRLSRLNEATNRTLATAAVIGREFDGELLEDLNDGDGSAVDHLDEALAARILVEAPSVGGRYGFSHALIRQTLYEELNPTRRARLHGRVAEALAVQGGSPASLARHYTAAHQTRQALAASVAAGREAEALVAMSEASRHYLHALDLWSEVEDPETASGADRPELLLRAAEVTQLLDGRLSHAIDLVSEAERSIDPEQDPVRAGVLAERMGRYLWVAGRGSEGIETIERAVALIPAEPPTRERAKALASLAGLLMLSAQHRAAEPRALEAIEVARAVGARAVEAHALVTIGTAEGLTGRVDDGVRHILEGRQISEQERALDDVLRSYANLASILDTAARLEEAIDDSLAGARIASDAGLTGNYFWFHRCNAAGSLIRLGRWDEAESLLFEFAGGDAEGVSEIYLHIVRATFTALTGRFDEARGHIARTMELIGGVIDPQLHGPAHWVAALVEFFDGDLDEAWSLIERGIDRVQKGEDWFYRAPLHVLGCAIAVEQSAGERANDARPAAEALMRIMKVMESEAEGADFGAQLAQVEAELTRFDGDDDPEAWARAAALWEAIPQPYDAAYCRFREGQGRIARGEAGEGHRLIGEAAAVADRLGALPLRRLIDRAG